MTIHYHGTPITPDEAIRKLAGKHFCVSFAAPQQIELVHKIGQSVMLDNGAFTFWRTGAPMDVLGFYRWIEPWLAYPTTWAVIPDVIEGTVDDNDALIDCWPFDKRQGAPVWHLHEPITRLLQLREQGWAKICFGSSGEYRTVGSKAWHNQIQEAFNYIYTPKLPWIHMLRGMQMAGTSYPFASLDSSEVGRNHHRKNNPKEMADTWDALQCPARWQPIPIQKGYWK